MPRDYPAPRTATRISLRQRRGGGIRRRLAVGLRPARAGVRRSSRSSTSSAPSTCTPQRSSCAVTPRAAPGPPGSRGDEGRLGAVAAHEPRRRGDLRRSLARPAPDQRQRARAGCRHLSVREATRHRGVDAVLGHAAVRGELAAHDGEDPVGGLEDRVTAREVARLAVDVRPPTSAAGAAPRRSRPRRSDPGPLQHRVHGREQHVDLGLGGVRHLGQRPVRRHVGEADVGAAVAAPAP